MLSCGLGANPIAQTRSRVPAGFVPVLCWQEEELLGEEEVGEQQIPRGWTRCDAAGDPQGSLGGRQEQHSQRCCFSITHLQ